MIKITDFGLSEDMYMRNYFRQGMAGEVVKLPVKWMAPESLSDGHFSEKSDVVCVCVCVCVWCKAEMYTIGSQFILIV